MPKITKHSAGGIVLDPKTEKILLTKKLAKKEYAATLKKGLLNLFLINPEEAIRRFKIGGFTKGKREFGKTIEETALQEIQEEGGIDPQDLIQYKYLGSFFKEKKYGFKEIEMFLYILTKEYSELNPTDNRHIAAFIDIQQATELIQSKEEKKFFEKIKNKIIQTLLAHKEVDILSQKKHKDVTEVDVRVER